MKKHLGTFLVLLACSTLTFSIFSCSKSASNVTWTGKYVGLLTIHSYANGALSAATALDSTMNDTITVTVDSSLVSNGGSKQYVFTSSDGQWSNDGCQDTTTSQIYVGTHFGGGISDSGQATNNGSSLTLSVFDSSTASPAAYTGKRYISFSGNKQ